jgi:TIR domain
MPPGDPQYDVAISFLSKDEPTAAAIYQRLGEGLRVFFFPRNQEALAGTEGLESMRKPFFDDSRVVVVLYREQWGKTPWTRVEETAVKEGCLERGWGRLFFVVLDKAHGLPVWLPSTHVRFNYADFGLEQAVGAIKARVQESGGEYLPMTAVKRAELFKEEELFRRDKSRLNSEEGVAAISRSVAELFAEIEKQCADIKGQALMQIRCGSDFSDRSSLQSCTVTDGRVGLLVVWRQQYINTLDGSGLFVREFHGGLILPSEARDRMYVNEPRQLSETKYSSELSRARQHGWSERGEGPFLSSTSLAEQCVIRFVDLANRRADGKLGA